MIWDVFVCWPCVKSVAYRCHCTVYEACVKYLLCVRWLHVVFLSCVSCAVMRETKWRTHYE